jgi:hypothetical protein
MSLTDAEVEVMKEKALTDRIKNEYIEVKLLGKPLTWRIDYREVLKWKKALMKWNEPYVMVNTQTGEVVIDVE